MKRFIAVIGYPIGHSISPAFQQAALDYYKLDIKYEAREVAPARLKEAIVNLRQPSNLGANVTIPHKEAVIPFLDELDELAAKVGAVNTIVNRDSKLVGYNTDVSAFLTALRQDASFEPQGMQVVLLGAGGEGRAAAFALVTSGIRRLTVFNRTFVRATRLVDSLRKYVSRDGVEVTALPWVEAKLREALLHCDLVVNCTSIGLKYSSAEGKYPVAREYIPKRVLVYDLEYNPLETPLLKEARRAGAETLSGLKTLVYQGAASFELWTGKKPPLDIMFDAASKALELKQQISPESKLVPV